VLIAVYNEEKHITRCLESLLQQTYPAVEILVVDDGSTDRTAEMVERFSAVHLLRQEHSGKARAVNLAAQEAVGEVLLFLDGDMHFAADYVEKMVEPIMAGRCLGTTHGNERVANPSNVWAACWQVKAGLPPDQRVCPTAEDRAQGSLVFRAVRRDHFLAVGGFDDIGYFDDQTLSPKLGERAVYVDEAACYHHNPDTLGQVFRAGVWGGKTLALRGGWAALFRHLPVFGVPRAALGAWRMGKAALFPYDLAREAGIFVGIARMLFERDAHRGA
jgi:glycosyltransferase involved in cell wall biosynthesis